MCRVAADGNAITCTIRRTDSYSLRLGPIEGFLRAANETKLANRRCPPVLNQMVGSAPSQRLGSKCRVMGAARAHY